MKLKNYIICVKYTCLLLLLISIAQSSFSQDVKINGKIFDVDNKINLSDAAVLLLRAKDSILYSYTFSDKDGGFLFKNIDTGRYIFLVLYPDAADYTELVTISDSLKEKDLGSIQMISKTHLLKEVIVSSKAPPISIKGDTTEFNASSYKVPPNANVEELLKKFPGIQVDKGGQITAMGEIVKKVLVDGEEFFGDDPTLATRNLRADMVNKVQLYQRSSEQAMFTGIDDGKKATTINLKLKENKKHGYFGTLEGGVGPNNFYNNQGYFNRFNGKEKMSIYGTYSNIGTTGLGFNEQSKLGTTFNDISVGDGVVTINNEGDALDNYNGHYSGQGIPSVLTGGIHYDNKWNDDKQSLNANYKIGKINTVSESNSFQQQNIGNDSSQYIKSSSKSNSYNFRQKLDATTKFQLGALTSITFSANGTLSERRNNEIDTSYTLRQDYSFINKNWRSINQDTKLNDFNTDILLLQKFKKIRRTLSLEINQSANNSNSNGYLNSQIVFYDSSNQNVNQFKLKKNSASSFSASVAYTEPLTTSLTLTEKYGVLSNKSNSNIQSYNQIGMSYTELDSANSNHYQFDQIINKTGTFINYHKGLINANLGTGISFIRFDQMNLMVQQNLKRNFTNWLPTANFQYSKNAIRLTVNYDGTTVQPSIAQLQPIQNNNDPLNIYIGNPNLAPAFNHNMSFTFQNYNRIIQRRWFLTANYGLTVNPIVSDISTNENSGENITSFQNLNNRTSNYFSLYSNWIKVIRKKGINYGFDLSYNSSSRYNLINDKLNNITEHSVRVSPTFSKGNDKYSIQFNPSLSYSFNNSTLQPVLNNNSYAFNGKVNVDVELPLKIELISDINYKWNQKTQVLPEFNLFIWNASIQRSFLKNDNLTIKALCNDMLNQSKGFNRSINDKGVVQNYFTSISRYLMLSLIWNFTKTEKNNEK